jgi:hypothetical protein
MRLDPATRVLSSAIKRSYAQHATQSSPRAQNHSPPPPAKRGAASSGAPSPFSSAHSTSKHFKLATRPSKSSQPSPSSSSLKQPTKNAKRAHKHSKKNPVVQKAVLPGPYHNGAYIENEYNNSAVALKSQHKETPKSSLHNFYQTLTGNLPKFTTIDGMIEGDQQVHIHR